jgi:sporulation protein YlmC with PRC-barrel domain
MTMIAALNGITKEELHQKPEYRIENQPDEVPASKMIGSTIYDTESRQIGTVKDLIVSRKDGKIAKVIVEVGKHVAINHDQLSMALREGSGLGETGPTGG